MHSLENSRLKRITQISRIFRRLCLLALIGLSIGAVLVLFLPIEGEEVKVQWNQKSGVDAEEVATVQQSAAAYQNAASNVQGTNQMRTIGWRFGIGQQNPRGPEKIRSEYTWTIRPFTFVMTLFYAAGAWILYRLFRFYERGTIFHADPVRCIRWLGVWLLARWLLKNLLELTNLFTHNPSYTDLSFDGYFFGGLLVLLISWIMEEGAKLREEQELTI